MDAPFLSGKNPVLDRELRVTLRNVRTFALLALYISILGAIVLSNFPNEQNFSIENGGSQGRDLFLVFVFAQAALVLIFFPAVATGAIAQERERHTLEPLLLTPLKPMQIVWGKASGVLALAVLLLASTLPLTSLYFFLGGLSPGELIAAYAVLLGLALFVTGLGLYHSAKTLSATRAMVNCYLQLPLFIGILVLFFFPGMLWSGLAVLSAAALKAYKWWENVERSRLSVAWRLPGRWLFLLGMGLLFYYALLLMVHNVSIGAAVVGVLFMTTYIIYAAQFGLQQAAREIVRRPEPRRPTREALHDLQHEWERAVAPPPTYMPSPTGAYTYTPQTPPQPAPPAPATYGKEPFLSDKLNPIFAKDMRTGLLGKFDYIFRFSYVATIGTELLLLAIMLLDAGMSDNDFRGLFSGWACLHLAGLMTFGAWFGARAFAPEREQQTLSQLLTVPLPASVIVSGKLQAAMVHTFYVFVMGVPLALMLPGLHLVTWGAGLGFIGLEFVFGAAACAWGLYCSIFGVTVRRALSWAIGGVLGLIMANILVATGVLWGTTQNADTGTWELLLSGISPFFALQLVTQLPATAKVPLLQQYIMMPVIFFSILGATFLWLTTYSFKNYAQNA